MNFNNCLNVEQNKIDQKRLPKITDNMKTSLFNNDNHNYNPFQSEGNLQQINDGELSSNYFGSNEITNKITNYNDNVNDSISIDEFLIMAPYLKDEIFQEIKRPIYIENAEIFQHAQNYVHNNLISKYTILKPKIDDNNFVVYSILLAIKLVNKYNIENYYYYLLLPKENTFLIK